MALPIDSINWIRKEELARLLSLNRQYFEGADVLEIGSGTGIQLKEISEQVKSAVGIDVKDGDYSVHRIADVRDYDGKTIPFPDASFDLIFSSHVLEHLIDETGLYREMARVLRPGGTAIHVVPTSAWRWWSWLGHYPDVAGRLLRKFQPGQIVPSPPGADHAELRRSLPMRLRYALYPCRHGEKGNWFTEFFWLRPSKWKSRLESHDWKVDSITAIGLWYSGYFFLDQRLSMRTRSKLARLLGSSAIVIVGHPSH
jgi:SAM-dependent methyltransferase